MFDRLKAAWGLLTGGLILKSDPTGPIVSAKRKGKPQFTEESYRAFADEAFRKNVVSKRCIEMNARCFAHLPISLVQKQRNGKRTKIEDPNNALIKLLYRPNPWQSGFCFWEEWASYFHLKGDTYLIGNGPRELGPDNAAVPTELWTPRPDRMSVIPGDKGKPKIFRFKMDELSIDFLANEDTGESAVWHFKSFNPLNDWYGLPTVKAASQNVDCHNSGTEWNMNVLQNSGRPSGAFVYKPSGEGGAVLTRAQRETLQDQIQTRITQPKNARIPLILDGGLEWAEMSMNAQELDWLEGLRDQARLIGLAYGVPGQILGIPGDATFANYEQARLAYYEETILPFADMVFDGLNTWLVSRFGDNLCLEVNKDGVQALSPRRKEIFDMAQKADFLTPNEKRVLCGHETIDSDDADKLWITSTLVPLDTNEDKENVKTESEDDINSSDGASVAMQALNGPQITALQALIDDIITGQLPPEVGRTLILASFPTLDPDAVDQMLEDLDGFEKPEPEPIPGVIDPATGMPTPSAANPTGNAGAAGAKKPGAVPANGPKPVAGKAGKNPKPKVKSKGFLRKLFNFRRSTDPLELKSRELKDVLKSLREQIANNKEN